MPQPYFFEMVQRFLCYKSVPSCSLGAIYRAPRGALFLFFKNELGGGEATELHKSSRGDIELDKKRTSRGSVAPPGSSAKWLNHGLVMDCRGNPATKRRYFPSLLLRLCYSMGEAYLETNTE